MFFADKASVAAETSTIQTDRDKVKTRDTYT